MSNNRDGQLLPQEVITNTSNIFLRGDQLSRRHPSRTVNLVVDITQAALKVFLVPTLVIVMISQQEVTLT